MDEEILNTIFGPKYYVLTIYSQEPLKGERQPPAPPSLSSKHLQLQEEDIVEKLQADDPRLEQGAAW